MIKNAKIESSMLGFEDHGILTISLHLDYGDRSSQGFGGYSLGGQTKTSPDQTVYLYRWVVGILKALEVETWEKLKGQHVRVRVEDGRVVSIGHFLKEQWFNAVE